MIKKVCVICGKEFETNRVKKITCSPECKHERKNIQLREKRASKKLIDIVNSEIDLKLWEILEIMYANNITIQQYLKNRNYYTLLYLRGNR